MNDTAPVAEGQVADAAPETQGQASESQAIWYDGAPDEVKGFIQNKGWDDPIKAVTSYQALEKFQGADPDSIIKLPKDGEPMDAVYEKLGRPKTVDEYKWEAPDGVSVDENYIGAIKAAAHESGVSQSAFEKLASTHAQYELQAREAMDKEIEQKQTAELNELQSQWGDKFDERVELGRRFVSQNIPADMDKAETLSAIEDAIGTAAMLKLFGNASEKAGSREDRLPSSDGDRPFGYTKEQATADRKELMQAIQADPERLNIYNSGKGNDFDKMRKLNQIVAS